MRRKYNKIPKLHIRKGDTVKVLSGNDKNKTGEVKLVNLKEGTAIVDGINMVTKHNYNTSGANDTIFINLRSLNSLATGPKIRVALGSSVAVKRTQELSSNRM